MHDLNAPPVDRAVIRRALLSVSDKAGLVPLAQALAARGVELLASGGTARVLGEAGLKVVAVEAFTQSPEVLDGRVKTLHPRIHAGILAHRGAPAHMEELAAHGYLPIDLVVCSLYPFAEALAKGGTRSTLVENIDIGGPTLVRAAAKNADGGVTVLADPQDYDELTAVLAREGHVPLTTRRRLQAKAFRLIAEYDLLIARWAEIEACPEPSRRDARETQATDTQAPAAPDSELLPPRLEAFTFAKGLRYGENPHQPAALYLAEADRGGIARGRLLQGKELSYNNYLDMDAAYRAAFALAPRHACAIIKHTNPCGLAVAATQAEAFTRALAADPLSAYGSVIGVNSPFTAETARAIRNAKLFVECIAAPEFTSDALAELAGRENLRLLVVPPGDPRPRTHAHRIGGGLLVQAPDPGQTDPSAWQCVTKRQPEAGWLEELAFAMHCAATLKSNAIAITKDLSLLGAGAGQMSRVDATEQAIKKAGAACHGAFLGSDAFFPFPDSVRAAAAAGIVAIVQPGGSKRDPEVVAACDELGLAMVVTGRRHFRH